MILLFFFLPKSSAQQQQQVFPVKANDTLPNGKIIPREFDKIPLGDIDNDKVADTARVNRPIYSDWKDIDCSDNNCEVTIFIKIDRQTTTIHFDNAVAAGVENIGDIDGDGYSELIAVPGWFIGCWGRYYFYSFKGGRWKEIGSIHHNLCAEDAYRKCIKKTKGNKITAIEQVWEEAMWSKKPKPSK